MTKPLHVQIDVQGREINQDGPCLPEGFPVRTLLPAALMERVLSGLPGTPPPGKVYHPSFSAAAHIAERAQGDMERD
jgi:hypothetical protein